MDKKQEKLFKAFIESTYPDVYVELQKRAWEACLDANGIGSSEESSAPSYSDLVKSFENIWYAFTRLSKQAAEGIDKGIERANEESEWRPKEGESVLVELIPIGETTSIAGSGVFSNGRIYTATYIAHKDAKIKPFDVSKLGNPWSEI